MNELELSAIFLLAKYTQKQLLKIHDAYLLFFDNIIFLRVNIFIPLVEHLL